MKEFKFFTSPSKKFTYKGNNKRYFGVERGVIKWTTLPTFSLYYLEPHSHVDAISNYDLPYINLQLKTEIKVLNSIYHYSFHEFLNQNENKYIIIYTIQDLNGNIYNETNFDNLDWSIPVTIRSCVFE